MNWNDKTFSEEELKGLGFKKIGTNIKISKNILIVGIENISLGSNIRIDDFTCIIAKEGFLSLYNNIHISSSEAYSGVTPKKPLYSLSDLIKSPVKEWQLQNDFEKSVFMKYSAIESLKKSLYENGAVYAAMSGSGSSVFGLFENRPILNYTESSFFLV